MMKPAHNNGFTKENRYNRAIAAIVAEGFLTRLSFGLISFALPLYAHYLGMSLAQIGFLISFDWIVALALKPLTGWLADRFGLKRTLTIAIGLRSVVALGLVIAGMPWQLFVVRALHGSAKALRDPAASALIAVHGGKKAIASTFAWYLTAKSVAGSLGKTLAGVLLTLAVANYNLVFAVACLLSLLPLYTVYRYIQEAPTSEHKPDGDTLVAKREKSSQKAEAPADQPVLLKIPPALLPYTFLGFLIAGTAQMLKGIFPIFAIEYAGLNEAQAGMIYTASTLVTLVAGPLLGWVADHVSGKLVLALRSIANICSSILYLISPELAGITAGKLIDDTGKAAFRPAWGLMLTQVAATDPTRRAQLMSIMSMGEDAGRAFGPILAGLLWSTWGIPVLFAVRILLAIVTELYALFLFRHDHKTGLVREDSQPVMHR